MGDLIFQDKKTNKLLYNKLNLKKFRELLKESNINFEKLKTIKKYVVYADKDNVYKFVSMKKSNFKKVGRFNQHDINSFNQVYSSFLPGIIEIKSNGTCLLIKEEKLKKISLYESRIKDENLFYGLAKKLALFHNKTLIRLKVEKKHYNNLEVYNKVVKYEKYSYYAIIHGDLNKKNILFNKDNDIYFVDIESIFFNYVNQKYCDPIHDLVCILRHNKYPKTVVKNFLRIYYDNLEYKSDFNIFFKKLLIYYNSKNVFKGLS